MSRLSTTLAATALTLPLGLAAAPAAAYPIDCAILLCLAGGWPISVECSLARVEFIRRITPWPIEPPLQIWNCPMHASLPQPAGTARLYRASAPFRSPTQSSHVFDGTTMPRPVAGQADIDISDPAFDFVRSVRVFEITYQQAENSDHDCNVWYAIFEGSYGEQGDYVRRPALPDAVPPASGLSVPANCGGAWYRSVFVEWRDSQGNYGFEEIRY